MAIKSASENFRGAFGQDRILNQEIAFSIFLSPEILGFLFPIEKAFVKNYVYERSLESLYDRWKDWQNKPIPSEKWATD
jgi:hypothetical protein